MRTIELCEEIEEAFPSSGEALPDDFIEVNPDLSLLDDSFSSHIVVPAYMAWCVRNSHRPAELAHDYTVRALAEFGRSKNPELTHLNFKHTCSPAQVEVVAKFLRWCLQPDLLLDIEQVKRSLRRWSAS